MSRFGDLLGGKKAAPAPAPAPVVEPVESPIVDEDTANYDEVIEEEFSYESDVSLHDMSKKELEDYGRTVGIELDRRHSRKRLVQELEEYLADS
tara:strand:- start:200 stop:481 length:282 start_codon:yes stop_codon:yes gene_type:complete